MSDLRAAPLEKVGSGMEDLARASPNSSRELALVPVRRSCAPNRWSCGHGLIVSVARLRGCLTSELEVKRLALLEELLPKVRRISVLADPTITSSRHQLVTTGQDLNIDLVYRTVANSINRRRSGGDSSTAHRSYQRTCPSNSQFSAQVYY
jgi:hypothetical protein